MDEEKSKQDMYEEVVNDVLDHLKKDSKWELSKDGKTMTAWFDVNDDGKYDIKETVSTNTLVKIGIIVGLIIGAGWLISMVI